MPLAPLSTDSGPVPFRTLVDSRPGGTRFFACPRCTVVPSFSAVSSTLLVTCLPVPSGPVRDRPCSLARRTSSLAATSSAEGPGCFVAMSFSVVSITAPSPLTPVSASGAETPLNPQSQRPVQVGSGSGWVGDGAGDG